MLHGGPGKDYLEDSDGGDDVSTGATATISPWPEERVRMSSTAGMVTILLTVSQPYWTQ